VQEGDHATLFCQPGPYARLWRIQTEIEDEPSSAEAS
jgi:hypothetical protein